MSKIASLLLLWTTYPRHLIFIPAIYGVGLWLYGIPLTGDQRVYISTALEMWQQGEWVYPIIHGDHNYFKPPLLYWATLTSWTLFGVSYFTALLPSMICTIGAAYFLSEISSLLGKKRKESLAGLGFAFCFGTLTYATTIQMEIYLVAFYLGAWWAGLKFVQTHQIRFLYGALIVAGLLGLIKSPLYSVLWVLGFWLFLALKKHHLYWRSIHFYTAHLVGIGVGVSWYAWVAYTDFQQFYDDYYVRESVMKRGGNGVPPWSIWWAWIYFSLPTILVLFPFKRIREAFKRIPKQRHHFLLAYCLLPFLFFSYFPYRLHTYLFILVPAIFLLIDFLMMKSSQRKQTLSFVLSSGICILLARLLFIAGGQVDLKNLAHLVKALPSKEVSFYNPERFIWHERGLLSLALGKKLNTYYNPYDAAEALSDGEFLILSDEEYKKFFSAIRMEWEKRGFSELELEVVPWERWKKRRDIHWSDIQSAFKANSFSILQREFKVVFSVRG